MTFGTPNENAYKLTSFDKFPLDKLDSNCSSFKKKKKKKHTHTHKNTKTKNCSSFKLLPDSTHTVTHKINCEYNNVLVKDLTNKQKKKKKTLKNKETEPHKGIMRFDLRPLSLNNDPKKKKNHFRQIIIEAKKHFHKHINSNRDLKHRLSQIIKGREILLGNSSTP